MQAAQCGVGKEWWHLPPAAAPEESLLWSRASPPPSPPFYQAWHHREAEGPTSIPGLGKQAVLYLGLGIQLPLSRHLKCGPSLAVGMQVKNMLQVRCMAWFPVGPLVCIHCYVTLISCIFWVDRGWCECAIHQHCNEGQHMFCESTLFSLPLPNTVLSDSTAEYASQLGMSYVRSNSWQHSPLTAF